MFESDPNFQISRGLPPTFRGTKELLTRAAEVVGFMIRASRWTFNGASGGQKGHHMSNQSSFCTPIYTRNLHVVVTPLHF